MSCERSGLCFGSAVVFTREGVNKNVCNTLVEEDPTLLGGVLNYDHTTFDEFGYPVGNFNAAINCKLERETSFFFKFDAILLLAVTDEVYANSADPHAKHQPLVICNSLFAWTRNTNINSKGAAPMALRLNDDAFATVCKCKNKHPKHGQSKGRCHKENWIFD
jgi:hypothetical protein